MQHVISLKFNIVMCMHLRKMWVFENCSLKISKLPSLSSKEKLDMFRYVVVMQNIFS